MASKKPYAVLVSSSFEPYDDGANYFCRGNFTVFCSGPVDLSAEALDLLCPDWMVSHKVVLLAAGRFDNAVAYVPIGTDGRLFRIALRAMNMTPSECMEKIIEFLHSLVWALKDPIVIGTMIDTNKL